jgi:hypothetical protein
LKSEKWGQKYEKNQFKLWLGFSSLCLCVSVLSCSTALLRGRERKNGTDSSVSNAFAKGKASARGLQSSGAFSSATRGCKKPNANSKENPKRLRTAAVQELRSIQGPEIM